MANKTWLSEDKWKTNETLNEGYAAALTDQELIPLYHFALAKLFKDKSSSDVIVHFADRILSSGAQYALYPLHKINKDLQIDQQQTFIDGDNESVRLVCLIYNAKNPSDVDMGMHLTINLVKRNQATCGIGTTGKFLTMKGKSLKEAIDNCLKTRNVRVQLERL